MASRKWLSVFALVVVLLVGWFVGMQSISSAQLTPEAIASDPLAAARLQQVQNLKNERLNLLGNKAEIDVRLEMLEAYLAALDKPQNVKAGSNPAPTPATGSRIAWEYLDENFSGEDAN